LSREILERVLIILVKVTFLTTSPDIDFKLGIEKIISSIGSVIVPTITLFSKTPFNSALFEKKDLFVTNAFLNLLSAITS
jgi:hypothetical protein